MHPVVQFLVMIAVAWCLVGLAFAVPFAVRGVTRIDPMAVGAPWAFRLLIVPATILAWPLLALRWLMGSTTPPTETNAHRRAARARQRAQAGGTR